MATRLEFTSRFRDTDLLITPTGVTYFSPLWARSPELESMKNNATTYEIQQKDIGRLDLVAYDTLGDVKLWWVIAALNDIVNPVEEMIPGYVLLIPSQQDVLLLTSRGPETNTKASL